MQVRCYCLPSTLAFVLVASPLEAWSTGTICVNASCICFCCLSCHYYPMLSHHPQLGAVVMDSPQINTIKSVINEWTLARALHLFTRSYVEEIKKNFRFWHLFTRSLKPGRIVIMNSMQMENEFVKSSKWSVYSFSCYFYKDRLFQQFP